jgi:hypothetical protein
VPLLSESGLSHIAQAVRIVLNEAMRIERSRVMLVGFNADSLLLAVVAFNAVWMSNNLTLYGLSGSLYKSIAIQFIARS